MLIKYSIKLTLIKKRFYYLNFVTSWSCLQAYIIFYKFRGCVNILYAFFTNFEDIKIIYIQEKKSICNICNKGRHGLYEGILIWRNGGAGFSIFTFLFFSFLSFFSFFFFFFGIEHNCFNRRNKVLFFYKKVILFKREREREREVK